MSHHSNNNPRYPSTDNELMLYRVLQRANLLQYYEAFISQGSTLSNCYEDFTMMHIMNITCFNGSTVLGEKVF